MEKEKTLNTIIPVSIIGIIISSLLQIKEYSYLLMFLCISINVCIVYKLRNQFTAIDLCLIAFSTWETIDIIFNRSYDISLLYGSLLALYAYFAFRFYKWEKSTLGNVLVIILSIFVVIGIADQYKQYTEIKGVGFSYVYSFRYIVKPMGFLINVWATITLLLLNLFGYFIIKKNKSSVILHTAYFLCLITLLLSFSRAGNFLAIISITFLFYYGKWGKTKYLFIGCFVIYFLIFLTFQKDFFASFSFIGNSLQQKSSLSRIEATSSIFKVIKEHPLIGYGIGNYLETIDSILFQDAISYTSYAPNLFSLYLIERGIVGIIPFCFIFLILFKMILRKDIDNANRYLILMIFLVIIKEMSLATIQYNTIIKILLYTQIGFLPQNYNIIKTKYTHHITNALLLCCYSVCSVFTYIQNGNVNINSFANEAYKKKDYTSASLYLTKVPQTTPFIINKRMIIINKEKYLLKDNEIKTKNKTSMLLNYTTYKLYNKNTNYKKIAPVYLKNCLQSYPKNILFKYLAYKESYQEGNFLAAATYLSDAIFLMPSLIEAVDIKYSLQNNTTFHSKLNRLIKKKLNVSTNSAKDIAYKGYIYYNMGNFEKAKEFLLKAVQSQENLAVPYYFLSQIYRKEKEYDKYVINKKKYSFLTKRENPLIFKEMSTYTTEEILLYYCFSQKFRKMYGMDLFTHIK